MLEAQALKAETQAWEAAEQARKGEVQAQEAAKLKAQASYIVFAKIV